MEQEFILEQEREKQKEEEVWQIFLIFPLLLLRCRIATVFSRINPSPILFLTLFLILFLTLSLNFSLSFSFSFSLSHSISHSLSHFLSHSLTHFLTLFLTLFIIFILILTFSLNFSLSHSHSISHSLSHSLSYTLSYSLSPSPSLLHLSLSLPLSVFSLLITLLYLYPKNYVLYCRFVQRTTKCGRLLNRSAKKLSAKERRSKKIELEPFRRGHQNFTSKVSKRYRRLRCFHFY